MRRIIIKAKQKFSYWFRRYIYDRRLSKPEKILEYRHRALTALGVKPILVYTVGKVGSMTVYNTLQIHKVSKLIYHLHFLNYETLSHNENKFTKAGIPFTSVSIRKIISNKIDFITTGYALRKVVPNTQNYIVTLVRDPIAIFLSNIFTSTKVYRPFLFDKDGNLSRDLVNKFILDYLSERKMNELYILSWFDTELKKSIGIDVYNYKFDMEKGWINFSEGNHSVALIALESLNTALSPAISALLGKEYNLDIVRSNTRDEMEHGDLYRDIKSDVVIPKSILKSMYNTKYAKHFYSDEFRRKMIDYWSRPRR